MKLDQFPDNHQIAYKVTLEAVKDITAPTTRFENVTKRKVREMFQRFIQASPELWPRSRADQISEFNSQRRAVHRPLVAPEILKDLEISYTESQQH
jgi:hypothetical protein